MPEYWAKIDTHPMYEISTRGNIKNVRTNTLKVNTKNKQGYYMTTLWDSGKRKTFLVHRLVAMYHIPNPCSLPIVDHIDGNPLNNNVANLRFVNSSLSNHNRRAFGSSGYKGVCIRNTKHGVKYKSQFRYNKVKYWLGTYNTAKEAALVWNLVALIMWGEQARLNEFEMESEN